MTRDLCDISLQQTRELVRLTESTLQKICVKEFSRQELYVDALRKVLGGKGRRGPRSIFIVSLEEERKEFVGRVFDLRDGEMLESSDFISIEPDSRYLSGLHQSAEVTSNWCDSCETMAEYQEYFHPAVLRVVGVPVSNFIFVPVPGEPPGGIMAFNYPGEATEYDTDVLRSLALLVGAVLTISHDMEETEKAFLYTIEALARACEAAEEGTGQHVLRVKRYAGALAANLGLPSESVIDIHNAAQMHDVGKIKVPTAILLKEGPLTPDEMTIMKLHPLYGLEILGDSPRLQVARDVAIAHHESWDGSGYPGGLKGNEIPLAGRIVKVADVYDALRSNRSYKRPYSHDEVLEIFRQGDDRIAPSHFDPEILATFFRIESVFAVIYDSLRDSHSPHTA